VGHEIDFTIADLVADQRAPTPTAAAEMVLPRKIDLTEQVSVLEQQLLGAMQFKIDSLRENFLGLVKRLSDPSRKLRENQQRLDELAINLSRRWQDRLRQYKIAWPRTLAVCTRSVRWRYWSAATALRINFQTI